MAQNVNNHVGSVKMIFLVIMRQGIVNVVSLVLLDDAVKEVLE